MNNLNKKTRFAPSPTGAGVCGSMRTALFAYCHAKKNGLGYAVRIEDTDFLRSKKEHLIDILENLEWLGIIPDEAPNIQDVKNDIADPKFFQSKQTKVYDQYLEKLLKEDKAYVADDKAVWFRMPKKDYTLVDPVAGTMTFPASEQKDFAIRRSDGTYLFHFSNVVSDLVEGMTLLVKGSDHCSNYPKHAAIFEAFDYPLPDYCHLALLLDAFGEKLSKRRNDQGAALSELREKGYMPTPIVNIMGLMGWKNPGGLEEFDLDYMCKNFDLKDCSNVNSRYDINKLTKMNKDYLAKMDNLELAQQLEIYANRYLPDLLQSYKDAGYTIQEIADLYVGRAKTLRDPFDSLKFLLDNDPEFKQEDVDKTLLKNDGASILESLLAQLGSLEDWDATSINNVIIGVAKERNIGIGKVAQPFRLAITGGLVSPPIDKVAEIMGKQNTLARASNCLDGILLGV